MRLRTYLGILFALVVVVAASFLTTLNRDLLASRFQVTDDHSIPVYAAILLVFLLGFLPVVTILLVQSLERDLLLRKRRRRSREAESLDGRYRRAIDFESDGQLAAAAALLEEVLTERPEDFGGLHGYGQVLRSMGRVDDGLEAHRRATVLYPQSVALLYQLADDYAARGESEVAAEIHNRILRDFPGFGLRAMRHRRDQALAESAWEEANQWQDKIESLRGAATSVAGGDADVALGLEYQKGIALLEADRAADAAEVFHRLQEKAPQFVPVGIMLGEAELLQNNAEAALDAWRRGFVSTGSPVYLQRIEDHFIEAEDPVRAIEALRALIAGAGGRDLLLRFFLGRLYYRLEMLDEASKVLDGLREAMDASPLFHYLLGRIHQRRDQPRRAMNSYLRSLQRLGIHRASFLCRTCNTRYDEWQDRCAACGAWNTVGLDVEETKIPLDDLGVVTIPVWSTVSNGETA